MKSPLPMRHAIWIVPAFGLLSGCASIPATAPASAAAPAAKAAAAPAGAASAPTAAARPAGAASAPTSAAAAPAPGAPRPFADVIKDAKRLDGLFAAWQKDDKVWLELKPEDFNQAFILSPKVKQGIGEGRFFFGGIMGEEVVVEFRRVHNQVQLLAKNMEFTAAPGTPAARAVEAAYSPSLMASTAVASQPHPERKTILVEANALFVNDMLGLGMQLQRQYRQGYALDRGNSAITNLRVMPDLVVFEALNHYATANIAVPTPGANPPGAPVPTYPRSVPDARSLFLTVHYSLAKLPAEPMRARKADPRVGYFTAGRADFTDDLARTPRERYVIRWRLDKKDPSAPLSEPVKPITFWLDRNIPVKYRDPIRAGVLEWNKAFEKIGFKDAVRVEIQPDDADWDTLDFGRASIRWMTNSSPVFGAIGPSHVDPRSGEILDADIGFESLSSRNLRALRSQILSPQAWPAESRPDFGAPSLRGMRGVALCDHADAMAEQLSYALEVLEARGELDPNSPEVEKFIYGYLKDTTMHEVGHTLGLRHNFRSSRVYTDAQVSDPAFTANNAFVGSVMEYAPINLAAPGTPPERRPSAWNNTLGPYDFWAIEYAYKPIAPDQEAAELARIAGRSAEPLLAYGTDEDNFLGVDPESLHFDLGNDVLAFARKRIAIARDLLERTERRQLDPGQDYSVLRRVVSYALRDMGRSASAVARQIGGVRTLRDHAGTGRDPLQPVPAAQQREALAVLTSGFLAADSFRLSPELQRKLAVDWDERTDAVFRGEMPGTTDYSPATAVLELQRGLLGQLMSDAVANRLLDSESKAPKDALRLRELYARLSDSVWSELSGSGEIAATRRELQREHANRLAGLLLRPSALTRADARGLVRAETQNLLARIEAAAKRAPKGSEARAHLMDSADTLAQALAAKPQRAGV